MSEHFADRLVDAIRTKGNPICVGLDPVYEDLPEAILGDGAMNDATDYRSAIDAISEFCVGVIRTVASKVPAIKINSAFFERYYWEGIEAYYSLVLEAEEHGLIVIGDVKRGDIGSTAGLYAQAHLGDPANVFLEEFIAPDAITINAFAGRDGIVPFTNVAKQEHRGVFVWCKASNPSAAAVQDFADANGKTLWQHLAEQVGQIAVEDGMVGESGFSCMGLVVGGTAPEAMTALREQYPQLFFLVPGYGKQGATAADCVKALKSDRTGALISASRSIICAHKDPARAEKFPGDWKACIADAVNDMNRELVAAIAAQASA